MEDEDADNEDDLIVERSSDRIDVVDNKWSVSASTSTDRTVHARGEQNGIRCELKRRSGRANGGRPMCMGVCHAGVADNNVGNG